MKTFKHFSDYKSSDLGNSEGIPVFLPPSDVQRYSVLLREEFAPQLDELRKLAGSAFLGEQALPVWNAFEFVGRTIGELAVLGAMQEHISRAESSMTITCRQQIDGRGLRDCIDAVAKVRALSETTQFLEKLSVDLRAEIAEALVESRAHVAEHAGVTAAAERFGSKLRKLVAKEETAAAQ